MKILVTGAQGFIGKNLIKTLEAEKKHVIYAYDLSSTEDDLKMYTKNADFVYHLAGINRPDDASEFMKGNFGFTSTLLHMLKDADNHAPIMLSSSIQAELDNPYGLSKKAGEELLITYGKETNTKVIIYRFPNVFGKWCRPNYNSVVATFCHNIAHDLPITISNPDHELTLVYIDDVVRELIHLLDDVSNDIYRYVSISHQVRLGQIAELIYQFKNSREERSIPSTSDAFTKKLYATYLTYLPKDQFKYPLKMNCDHRGSFTEFIKTIDRGQVSVNISKPGITKGNHWHHTKNEKFLVVSGTGIIRFRHVLTEEVIEYVVSGDHLEVVDIPPGYTHNIENLGQTDMVTIMWANEMFDPNRPDTTFEEV